MENANKLEPHVTSYRPDIDGLRAIAVIGVVLFHAGLGVPGGFAGVDVFFVISGYLITLLILRDLKAGQFSIVTFWERRVRRILPALAVVVLTILTAGWFLSLPFNYMVIGQLVIALIAISSNIQFWRTTDYFNPQSEENPLLHTWSLSVEEQFYLIVPFLLLIVFRWRRERWVPKILVVSSLASFFFSIFYIRHDPTGAFYLLPSRAWELGMGCILAVTPPIKNNFIRSIISYFGLFLILMTFMLYDSEGLFPGIKAIPPVFGALFLIWSGSNAKQGLHMPLINRVLSNKVLTFIGLCSYSFYLWHWPFFAFHRYLFSGPPSLTISIVYVLVSFLISILSLFFIEKPFRSSKIKFSKSRIFILSGFTIFSLLVTSLYIYTTGGIPMRLPMEITALDSASGDHI